jgi:hypothetical protein
MLKIKKFYYKKIKKLIHLFVDIMAPILGRFNFYWGLRLVSWQFRLFERINLKLK